MAGNASIQLFLPFCTLIAMATAPTIRKKNAVYQANINKRGQVKSTLKEKKSLNIPITYWAFGIIAFALVGGAILQVLDLMI
ncbi:hypothetical protein K492DRAFT_207428 [Lichtheimia hyalospora FSU 10163]|nr:hypothetical protein K492DRAFT_207428 [Lichtheimia hyalospora FSU 10163]